MKNSEFTSMAPRTLAMDILHTAQVWNDSIDGVRLMLHIRSVY